MSKHLKMADRLFGVCSDRSNRHRDTGRNVEKRANSRDTGIVAFQPGSIRTLPAVQPGTTLVKFFTSIGQFMETSDCEGIHKRGLNYVKLTLVKKFTIGACEIFHGRYRPRPMEAGTRLAIRAFCDQWIYFLDSTFQVLDYSKLQGINEK